MYRNVQIIYVCSQYVVKSYHTNYFKNNSLEIFIKLINANEKFVSMDEKNNEINDLNI